MPEIWLETSKNSFWQKPDFVKINEFSLLKLKKCKNRKIDTFMFLAISLAIFELQRRTIPHFNPHNNSFWPYEEQFCCRVNRFWVIRPNVSTIFFHHTLLYHDWIGLISNLAVPANVLFLFTLLCLSARLYTTFYTTLLKQQGFLGSV